MVLSFDDVVFTVKMVTDELPPHLRWRRRRLKMPDAGPAQICIFLSQLLSAQRLMSDSLDNDDLQFSIRQNRKTTKVIHFKLSV